MLETMKITSLFSIINPLYLYNRDNRSKGEGKAVQMSLWNSDTLVSWMSLQSVRSEASAAETGPIQRSPRGPRASEKEISKCCTT